MATSVGLPGLWAGAGGASAVLLLNGSHDFPAPSSLPIQKAAQSKRPFVWR